jgi:hypothetical protein
MSDRSAPSESSFHVPLWLHLLGGLIGRCPGVCTRLARLESGSLAEALDKLPVTMPIFVCGLARAGTTLLHEIVAAHPSVATHRMKDYPMLFTPYWWRRAAAKRRPEIPRERAHRDGIMVTTESPDALEEMLWTRFFPHCHDPAVNNVLSRDEQHPAFETFYRNHIRKLLLAEHASRYAAKANYHVARLAYLVRLFPDAKFLIAIRSPERQIASLVRQHAWFCGAHREFPRALAFMQRSGHFEFGLDRRPMQLGDAVRTAKILDDWSTGRETCGWALYWDMIYSYLFNLLATDEQVRAASLVIRFETLCESPAETLRAVFLHCRLPEADCIVDRFTRNIREPSYDTSRFSPDDQKTIQETTAETASRWGYT